MESNRLGRALSLGVAAVAVFNTLAALSLPFDERHSAVGRTLLIAALLLVNAALYWRGERLRARAGLTGYVAAQAATVFLVGISGALFPVGVGLYVALIAETVTLGAQRWGTMPITLGRSAPPPAPVPVPDDTGQPSSRRASPASDVARVGIASRLTPREHEVLFSLSSGARTSEIADRLGIAERAVKGHLASIYLKLGVGSRTAAVAAVLGTDTTPPPN